jgi:2'-5' RNA ligase
MAATAIIIPVPQAASVTQVWRQRYTGDGPEGMPPHITLLYPFVDASEVVAEDVGKVLARFEPVEFTLASTARFAGTRQVLYLKPTPDAVFQAMTNALVAAFPQYPPYEGAFGEVVPHLTVAEGVAEGLLARIENQVRRALPIRAQVSQAWLMAYQDSAWRLHTRFPLGGAHETDQPQSS